MYFGIGIGIGWKVSVSVSKFGIANSLNNYAVFSCLQDNGRKKSNHMRDLLTAMHCLPIHVCLSRPMPPNFFIS